MLQLTDLRKGPIASSLLIVLAGGCATDLQPADVGVGPVGPGGTGMTAMGGAGAAGGTAGAGVAGAGTAGMSGDGGNTLGGIGGAGSGGMAGAGTAGTGAGTSGAAGTGGMAGAAGTGGMAGAAGTGGMAGTAGMAGSAGAGGTTTDQCPLDPNKTEPGECGCGVVEVANCLTHRYSFSRTDAVAEDSVGSANGAITSATQANGVVTLTGAEASNVDLPDNLLSGLESATIEIWASWSGGASWQRVFDFGSNDGTDGQTYLFLTPSSSTNGFVRFVSSMSGGDGESVSEGSAAMPTGSMTHYACVYDHVAGTQSLYQNGSLLQTSSMTTVAPLTSYVFTNNWVGDSNYTVDPSFTGTVSELRIFSTVRTAEQISASSAGGPDADP